MWPIRAWKISRVNNRVGPSMIVRLMLSEIPFSSWFYGIVLRICVPTLWEASKVSQAIYSLELSELIMSELINAGNCPLFFGIRQGLHDVLYRMCLGFQWDKQCGPGTDIIDVLCIFTVPLGVGGWAHKPPCTLEFPHVNCVSFCDAGISESLPRGTLANSSAGFWCF